MPPKKNKQKGQKQQQQKEQQRKKEMPVSSAKVRGMIQTAMSSNNATARAIALAIADPLHSRPLRLPDENTYATSAVLTATSRTVNITSGTLKCILVGYPSLGFLYERSFSALVEAIYLMAPEENLDGNQILAAVDRSPLSGGLNSAIMEAGEIATSTTCIMFNDCYRTGTQLFPGASQNTAIAEALAEYPTRLPVGMAGSSSYFFVSGPNTRVVCILTMNNRVTLQAALTTTANQVVLRAYFAIIPWDGETQNDDAAPIPIEIPIVTQVTAGAQAAGTVLIGDTQPTAGVASPLLSAGWYRLEYRGYSNALTVPIRLDPRTGQADTSPLFGVRCQMAVSFYGTGSNSTIAQPIAHWVPVVPNEVDNRANPAGTPIVGSGCRVTAASLLATNTTAELYKQGTAYGQRYRSKDVGMFSESMFTNIQTGYGRYQGPAAKGNYTFKANCVADTLMYDFTDVSSGGLFVPLDRDTWFHAIQWVGITNNIGATPVTATCVFTLCMHLEFMTTSMLFPVDTSPYRLMDLMEARRVINSRPEWFYENELHMRDIYNFVRRIGAGAMKMAKVVAPAASLALKQSNPVAAALITALTQAM